MKLAAIVREVNAAIAAFLFLYKNGNFMSKTVIFCHLVWAK